MFFVLAEWCCHNCQNPNSTKTSVQQSLRLDYILTVISTPPHPPHHQELTMLLLLLTGQAVQARQSVQLYSHTQVSASLHCISERLTFLFSKAWDFENFWLRIQKYCGYGQKGYSLGLKKKISDFGAIFFQNHSRREKSKTWTSLGTYFSVCSYWTYLSV